MPVNDVHDWFTARGVRGQNFDYPQTQNYQRGAITNNFTEGTVFLPNCDAFDINADPTFQYLRQLLGWACVGA